MIRLHHSRRWKAVAVLICTAMLGLGLFSPHSTAQRIAPESGPSSPRPQTKPIGVPQEVWDELSELWANMTPEQKQQAIDQHFQRMNPTSNTLQEADRLIQRSKERSQGPVMRQAEPGEVHCIPNETEKREYNPGCGLTAGGNPTGTAPGIPALGIAVSTCKHVFAAGACRENCNFDRCIAPGSPPDR
jgi:hypothetical protein